ncbi:hypothetical protein [Microlunatus flavus]|uniref:Uncharacterized protein n=1 Tax=Microlunatus flavus TaxID=1036181 RepID=A0A1H9AGP1_9ACTN|nr:hypothetical protein [Microlunatus flavus]SEP75138.1 hypothetical protein SAMN05421756_101581 [Microlunatus flavus]
MTETATDPAAPASAAERAPAPGEPQVRLPVAVLAVVATIVAALLVVALVVRLGADRLPTAPPRDPPAAPATSRQLSLTGRQVTLDEFSMTLPGPPFACGTLDQPPPTGFAQIAVCSSVVHRDYDGKGSDWVAASGVALLADSAVDPDLATTTGDAFTGLLSAFYDPADHPSPGKQTNGPQPLRGPSGAAWTEQADVRVERAGLPTPYDRLVVIVVRLESGQHVAFFSDFPHDGSKQALQAVVDAANTLEARR